MGGRSMVAFHKEYSEYATCSRCGMKKNCKLEGRHFICYSCDNGNFNGLKNIKKKEQDK